MYDMGCFSSNGFYPGTSSCSSNASSPDSLKHQRLLITATPSPPTVAAQQFFPQQRPLPPPPSSQQQQQQQQQQQFLLDHHRFRFNHNNNNNNNNNNNSSNNSNSNGSSEIHASLSATTISSQDPLSLWLAAQSSGQQAASQSRFFPSVNSLSLSPLPGCRSHRRRRRVHADI